MNQGKQPQGKYQCTCHLTPLHDVIQASYGGHVAAPWGVGANTTGLIGAVSQGFILDSGEYINQVQGLSGLKSQRAMSVESQLTKNFNQPQWIRSL